SKGAETIGNFALVPQSDITGRMCRTFAKEILFHLAEEELLRLGRSEVQAIFVHDHFHLLDPHLPGVFRDVFIDSLSEGVAVKRNLVESRQLLVQLHTKYLALGL